MPGLGLRLSPLVSSSISMGWMRPATPFPRPHLALLDDEGHPLLNPNVVPRARRHCLNLERVLRHRHAVRLVPAPRRLREASELCRGLLRQALLEAPRLQLLSRVHPIVITIVFD